MKSARLGYRSARAMFLVALILVVVQSRPASSATVHFAHGTVADNVTGLVVGGEVYDVDFVGNISSNDWLSMLDFTTLSEANEAAATLAAALNDAGATAVILETSIGTLFDDARNIAIPYGVEDNHLVTASTQRLLSSQSWTLLTNSFSLSDSTYPFAMVWTPAVAPVPLPAALPLLLGGLAGLLLVGRRKPV